MNPNTYMFFEAHSHILWHAIHCISLVASRLLVGQCQPGSKDDVDQESTCQHC